jgi:hypothetical protein
MQRLVVAVLAAGAVLGSASRSQAAEDDAQAIIAKAIKAYGGKEKLGKSKALQLNSKGQIELMGAVTAFSQEISSQITGQFKQTLQLDVNSTKVKIITAFDGKKGWLSANGVIQDLPEAAVREMKEAGYLMNVNLLSPLTDKKQFDLSLLGEVQVNSRPAIGVKVSSKGHKDVNLYFDKEKGLMAKIERRKLDFVSGKEVTEERIITEYQEVEGLKTAKKVLINIDGKKLLEAEVTEIKFVDKINDTDFAKP